MRNKKETLCIMNIGQSESESPADKKRLLYIDSYLAVFNKACGDICEEPSLPFIFARCFKDLYGDSKPLPPFIHCFNRLDRPVSGAVLLVFDKAFLPRLQNQFTEHQKKALAVKKVYTAVLEGSLPISGDFALLEHYLRFDARRQKAFVCEKDARRAKLARLLWRPVFSTGRYTFAEIELITGRTHQIRCQLAHEGYHIKGDVKYGARRSDPLGGIRLHASRLRFEHPVTNEVIDIAAPLLKTDALWQAYGGF